MSLTEHIARYERMTLPLDAQLGHLMMPVGELLALTPGSVIALSRPVGSKIDVYVGGAPFGTGELISAGKLLALRFWDFSSQEPAVDSGQMAMEEHHVGA